MLRKTAVLGACLLRSKPMALYEFKAMHTYSPAT